MDFDEVWLCVSPENPHKSSTNELEEENHRLEMAKVAVKGLEGISCSDVEFRLPRPSYTDKSLELLRQENPKTEFSIIAGTDTQHKLGWWENAEEILRYHDVVVYPRVMSAEEQSIWPITKEVYKKSRYMQNVPVLEISATYIRNQIKENKSIRHLVPESVINYIMEHKLFKK